MTGALQTLVASLMCWLVASSLWIYPHSLSYFNESVGGPLKGAEHLLGSNVDWGQDLKYLLRFAERSNTCRPLYLAHAGYKNFASGELTSTLTVKEDKNSNQPCGVDGDLAISINYLFVDTSIGSDRRGQFTDVFLNELRRSKSIACTGYSVRVFDLHSTGPRPR